MLTSTLRFLFSAALVFVCLTTFAVSPPPKEGGQTPSPTKSPTATPKPTPAGAIDEKLFSGMQWRQIGPFRGGRALAIEGVPGEPDTYYFGAVAGGVWKTTDGGQNWTPLFDKEDISSIGAIAVAPSDHNVVYAGTGEAAIREAPMSSWSRHLDTRSDRIRNAEFFGQPMAARRGQKF